MPPKDGSVPMTREQFDGIARRTGLAYARKGYRSDRAIAYAELLGDALDSGDNPAFDREEFVGVVLESYWSALPMPQAGFTLVELMITTLVIGILLAIGVPTLLGAVHRSQDRRAQASVVQAVKVSRVYESSSAFALSFATMTASDLTAIEPSLSYGPGPSDGPRSVSFAASPDGAHVGIAVLADGGTCWLADVDANNTVGYGSASSGSCDGSRALGVSDSSW
jgi:prepilin-type N-terminal cleavage/methylation domain-containing protein